MASNSDPPSDPPAEVPIREELINTAVKFLSNPNVQKSAYASREAFLRGKGLTDQEIAVAFQRTPITVLQPQQPPAAHTAVTLPYPQGYLLPPQSGWARFRDTVNTFAIIGGFVYGVYLLYKRYIAPFLFGPSKKKSPIEASIAALDESVKSSFSELRTELRKTQKDMEEMVEQQIVSQTSATARQVDRVKNEINTLKGIFLNKSKFAGGEDPSDQGIPGWQSDEDPGLPNGTATIEDLGESLA